MENPHFRIRAKFRDSTDESVGNATVKVKSRFMQQYYGGVTRLDEYRFQLEIDSLEYANKFIDVKVNDYFVGTHAINSSGFLDVTYRSDFQRDDVPYLPLPANFPNRIDVGHTASVYDTLTHDLLLTSVFGEEFPRGDSDHDMDVDDDDYHAWCNRYGSNGIGPAAGDYNGDGRADTSDYIVWRGNYTAGIGPPLRRNPYETDEPADLVTATLAILPRRRRTIAAGKR